VGVNHAIQNGFGVKYNYPFYKKILLNFRSYRTIMKGINFVINEKGEKKAVLIDLEEWGELWEDFSDILVSRSRENESEISWDELKQELETENTFDE
jgi:hypothetical protein